MDFNGHWLLALPDDVTPEQAIERWESSSDLKSPSDAECQRLWCQHSACVQIDLVVDDIRALRMPPAGGGLDDKRHPDARAVRHVRNVDDAVAYWTDHVANGEHLRYFVDRYASHTMRFMWTQVFEGFPSDREFGWKARTACRSLA